jgi:hypothetical protein
MASPKAARGSRPKGASLSTGAGTVNVVLPASTAKDLLHALTLALGGGGGKKAKAASKPKAAARPKATARPKAATSRARAKGR